MLPCAIFGGGYSLNKYVNTIPNSVVKFSVNHHALHITNCEYVIYSEKECLPFLKEFKNISHINPFNSDIEVPNHLWEGTFSSGSAVKIVHYLGYDPIFLYGMDCYSEGHVYCHNDNNLVPENPKYLNLEQQLKKWSYIKSIVPYANVIVVNGPLREIWK